jgi:hypothetical protein
LDKAGERVLLSFLPGTAEDRVVDAIAFKGQENERSLGRYPDGSPWWFAMLRSSNTVNTAGLVGPVINEIMYHPPDLGTNDNTADEFVELFNPTAGPIALQDTNGFWRIDGGISFTFPANTSIPAGGTLLLVNFDPADSSAAAAFRSHYGMTNTSVGLMGPYAGKLANRSDRVALEKPLFPDLPGDPYSWVIVDEAIYGNQNPWPTNANGGGFSLQRALITRSGNDPANWVPARPTPGLTGAISLDRDGDGLPDSWELSHGLDPDDPVDAGQDADGDRMTNLAEFLSGTDPHDASSVLGFDFVSVAAQTISLHFTALENRSYTVQFQSDAATGLWERLADVGPGAQRPIAIPDTDSAVYNHRFYRIVTPALP